MAPEVYGNQPYGSKADQYSLGLVLYWLLNERRLPFVSLPPAVPKVSEEREARERRFQGEPLPPPAYGSRELQRIVLKACAFDPQDRYETAEEMLRDLESLGGRTANEPDLDRTITALPGRTSANTYRENSRKATAASPKKWILLAAAGALLLLAVLGWFTEKAERRAKQPTSSRQKKLS